MTDAALEYIACDLNNLSELTLDRCVHVTDIGIGYISTMLELKTLSVRWCTQIRDFGLQHICGMRSMQILSLAGTNSIKLLQDDAYINFSYFSCRMSFVNFKRAFQFGTIETFDGVRIDKLSGHNDRVDRLSQAELAQCSRTGLS